jgi:hypothetical protein
VGHSQKQALPVPAFGIGQALTLVFKNPFLQLVQTDSNLSFSTILVTLGMSYSKEI